MSLTNNEIFNLKKSKKSLVFSQNSSTSGSVFKYIGGDSILYKNLTLNHNGNNSQLYQVNDELNLVTSNVVISSYEGKDTGIKSKGLTGNQGKQVGNVINKDMSNGGCDSLPASYAPNNIQILSGTNSSYWEDWGNDIFDSWGYFYIFDVATNQYYFPIFNPRNLNDGIITTQNFNAFGRVYTIKHGYPAQGIFKFEITCSDNSEFIFGAYGNMGSDSNTDNTNLTQEYTISRQNFTLYYNRNVQTGSSIERLFSYFIPSDPSLNNTKTYNDFIDDDDLSLFSVPVKNRLTVYFAKTYDVKDWVINDLMLPKSKLSIIGDILSTGSVFNNTSLINLNDTDYTCSASKLINGYFTNSSLSEDRSFILPTASQIVASIEDCVVGTSFNFTINNVQANNYSRYISINTGVSLIGFNNTYVLQNYILTCTCIITNINLGSEAVSIVPMNNVSLIT